MKRPARAIVAAITFIVGLLCAAGAVRAGALDPTDHVPGHPTVTYFDLVKQVVTDLDSLPVPGLPKAGEPAAHTIAPYRHIEGDDAKTVPERPVAIQLLTAQTIKADGKSRLALMMDLGPSDEAVTEFTLLALFDTADHLADQPKLLDVVEVGTDRLTGFAGKPLPLDQGHKAGADLITISSDHFNSNEDFVGTEFVFVRNNHFQLAGSLFTFDLRVCTSRRSQEPAITTVADPGRRYRKILVAVNERVTLEPDRADCSGEKIPRPIRRTYHAIYRWNAARKHFEIASSDLQKLDRENKKLMSGGL
jgi:hypothetical protein